MKDTPQKYKEKLTSSALTLADAKKLGYEVVTQPTKLQEHYYNVPAFKLPYYTAQGKVTAFYRIRYLYPTRKGFSRVAEGKDRRYDQPPAEAPQLYIPHILPNKSSWVKLFAEPNIPIVLTEGELKAACATKHGIPTLALGGVWNFKSKKNGLLRIKALEEIKWKGRTAFVVYDSDSVTNPQVLLAQFKLCEELINMGADPIVVSIPKEEGKKHGIDDYIVEHGAEAFKKLLKDPANHQDFAFTKELMKLNSEIAVVHKPMSIIHFPTGQLLRRPDAEMFYANVRMIEQVLKRDKKGEESVDYKEVKAFSKWLEWEQRSEVHKLVYEPGAEKFIEEDGHRAFNVWEGWGCVPEKGDVSLWKWLLAQVFKNAEKEHIKWFEQWCAYPLQNPGVKMFTSPVLFGRQKGTGKSLVGLSVASIYGTNAAEITDTQLEDERNVFAAKKQFVVANEVTGSDRRSMAGRVRNLITQHEIFINKKYEPDYSVRDTINYFFSSNDLDALYIDDEERRFFAHEVLGPRLVDVDKKKVRAYDDWLKSGACARALFYYFLNMDLSGFDPTAPAPDTESKRVMIEASLSEVEAWCYKLFEDPDTCLRVKNVVIPFSLFRVKDLVDIYASSERQKRPYEKTMSNALRKAGFKKAARGQSCHTKDGKINLWLIRNIKKYEHFSSADIAKAYNIEREVDASKDKKFTKRGSK